MFVYSDGSFKWADRTFELSSSAKRLSANGSSGRRKSYDLTTGKFSRLWSTQQTLTVNDEPGYGLDIVWKSGHIWSLLASEEKIAQVILIITLMCLCVYMCGFYQCVCVFFLFPDGLFDGLFDFVFVARCG
jgi:hypothetical protein